MMKVGLMRAFIKNNAFLRTIASPIIVLRRRAMEKDKRAYDRYFESVVGGSLLLKLDNIPGIFEIDARSHLTQRIMRFKEYETDITQIIERYIDADRDAIDIGGNVGLISCLIASRLSSGQKVVCVEPLPNIAEKLRRNLELNKFSGVVEVHECVVSDKAGTLTMNYIPGKEEYSSINRIVHHSVQGLKSEKVEVESHRLDDLLSSMDLNPGFMKIDTEGAEMKVLTGALCTIREFSPVIVCELSDKLLKSGGSSAQEVVELLSGEGYSVVDVLTDSPIVPDGFFGDILAVPSKAR
jgi:FkbM family methyltransferase